MMHCGSPWPKVRSALVMCVVYFLVGLLPLVCETSTLSVVRRRMVCALIMLAMYGCVLCCQPTEG